MIRFINAFREFAADGVLTRAEWKELEELATGDNLDINEALYYAQPDVSELVRKGVEIATKDNIITEHEEKYFDFVLGILTVPESLVNEVRSTISEYKAAQEIRKGNLPTVQPSFTFGPGEICHLEVKATYINTDTKTYPRRFGRLWATNRRLQFISPERDFDLEWRKVRNIARDGNTLVLEMTIKKGNGIYIVDQPLIAEAVITRLIHMSSQSESQRVPPRDKQTRHQEPRGNATNSSLDQEKKKSPYDILDLPSNADVETIKLAYRRMAKLYHPDKVAALAPEFQELAERRMKEINSAFQELIQ